MRYLYRRRRASRRRQGLRYAARAGLIAAAVLAWSQAAAGTLDLTVRNGLVSLDAHAAPLGAVLRSLSEKAGFRLVMKQDLRAPVTWRLDGVPVEQAVTHLLARVSSVALYAPAGEGAGSVLTEVRVLRGGNSDVPLVEHHTDLAAVQDTQAGIDGPDRALAEEPAPHPAARPRLADALGLQTAAREVGPIDPALEDGNAAARQDAVLRAAQRRPDLARGALHDALSDPDTVVRQRAVQGLVRLGGEEAVTALSQVLLEDPKAGVRRMAAAGLGRMNTESAFWALMEASSDADQDVREAVSAALVGLERRGIAAGNRSGTTLQ